MSAPTIPTPPCHDQRSDAAPDWIGDRWRLRAEGEWRFSGDPETLTRVWEDLRPFSQRLTADVLVRFGNAVGLFRTRDFGLLETYSGKLTKASWESMLSELTEEAAGLPFTAGIGAVLPFDRSLAARDDLLYHAFVYLRTVLLGEGAAGDALPDALARVVRDPHRQLQRTTRSTPLELAHRMDGGRLLHLAGGQGTLHPARGTAATVPLATYLRGRLPESVSQEAAVSSVDTPENRFVLGFLGICAALIQRMRRVTTGRRDLGLALSGAILADCEGMERLLAPYRAHALWREVGPMAHLPVASPVLQRRPGYQEVYRHYSRLRLAAQVPLLPEQVRMLLEGRDIARMYELWAFFRVARTLRELLGPPDHAEGPQATEFQVQVGWGLRVAWNSGVELFYNPSFSRSGTTSHRAYSLSLRPDIGLRQLQGRNAGWHLLDAKFRLQVDEGTSAPGEDATEGTFYLREDLHKMHAYRDAIAGARTAWMLYPGERPCFFPVEGTGEGSSLRSAEKLLEGVGALTLLPGVEPTSLVETLASLAA